MVEPCGIGLWCLGGWAEPCGIDLGCSGGWAKLRGIDLGCLGGWAELDGIDLGWMGRAGWNLLNSCSASMSNQLPLLSVAFMGWWPGRARCLQTCHQFITAKCKPKFRLHCQWYSPA